MIDPTGLFAKEIVEKNLSLAEIGSIANGWRSHPHWGFYLLLRSAENWDSINVGYVNLPGDRTSVYWSEPQNIRLINCDQIIIGSQLVDQYYETVVKRRNMPLNWWRDTTATHYQIKRGDLSPRVVADGSDDNTTNYPHFKGLAIGAYGELDLIVDIDGNKYLGISGGPLGEVWGFSYIEGYLCNYGQPCSDISPSEMEKAMAGICFLPLEAVFVTGINLSFFCHGFNWHLREWSKIYTFYLGLEGGGGTGASAVIPLSWFGVAPEPIKGWRWALRDQQNGITYNKIVSWEGSQ